MDTLSQAGRSDAGRALATPEPVTMAAREQEQKGNQVCDFQKIRLIQLHGPTWAGKQVSVICGANRVFRGTEGLRRLLGNGGKPKGFLSFRSPTAQHLRLCSASS